MDTKRRERLPASARTNLYMAAIFFDPVRFFIGGIAFVLGTAIWLFSLLSIIGAFSGTFLGLAISMFGSSMSIGISMISAAVLGWMYHSRGISLLDRSGAKLIQKILFVFLSVIPLIPWTTLSVALVIRAVEKEDREYNESRGL